MKPLPPTRLPQLRLVYNAMRLARSLLEAPRYRQEVRKYERKQRRGGYAV